MGKEGNDVGATRQRGQWEKMNRNKEDGEMKSVLTLAQVSSW